MWTSFSKSLLCYTKKAFMYKKLNELNRTAKHKNWETKNAYSSNTILEWRVLTSSLKGWIIPLYRYVNWNAKTKFLVLIKRISGDQPLWLYFCLAFPQIFFFMSLNKISMKYFHVLLEIAIETKEQEISVFSI